jgi:hypothetical protein
MFNLSFQRPKSSCEKILADIEFTFIPASNILSVSVNTVIHAVCIPWIPTEHNTQAGYLNRIIDIDDWAIYTEFFQFIDELWDPHSVDRFASSNNVKTKLVSSHSRF